MAGVIEQLEETKAAGREASECGVVLVATGGRLFEFSTFQNWVNSARSKFSQAGVDGRDVLCLDAKGRVCQKGKEFMRARDDDSFPVTVYRALCN